MTPEEFRELIHAQADSELLGPLLHDGATPYVFDPEADAWTTFRAEIAQRLGVAAADITIVGSGRWGFSLKPGSSMKPFTDKSDVDVIIVNADAFDSLWYSLLQAAYPRVVDSTRWGSWLRKRKYEVYTGWLSPSEINLDLKFFGAKAKAALDFNALWFNTFKKAARHVVRRHEDINGRLYRTWKHAELYHLDSFASLRRSLDTRFSQ